MVHTCKCPALVHLLTTAPAQHLRAQDWDETEQAAASQVWGVIWGQKTFLTEEQEREISEWQPGKPELGQATPGVGAGPEKKKRGPKPKGSVGKELVEEGKEAGPSTNKKRKHKAAIESEEEDEEEGGAKAATTAGKKKKGGAVELSEDVDEVNEAVAALFKAAQSRKDKDEKSEKKSEKKARKVRSEDWEDEGAAVPAPAPRQAAAQQPEPAAVPALTVDTASGVAELVAIKYGVAMGALELLKDEPDADKYREMMYGNELKVRGWGCECAVLRGEGGSGAAGGGWFVMN